MQTLMIAWRFLVEYLVRTGIKTARISKKRPFQIEKSWDLMSLSMGVSDSEDLLDPME